MRVSTTAQTQPITDCTVSALPSLTPLQGNFFHAELGNPPPLSFRYLKNVPVFAGQIMLKKKLEKHGSKMFQLMPPAPLGSLLFHVAVQVVLQG